MFTHNGYLSVSCHLRVLHFYKASFWLLLAALLATAPVQRRFSAISRNAFPTEPSQTHRMLIMSKY